MISICDSYGSDHCGFIPSRPHRRPAPVSEPVADQKSVGDFVGTFRRGHTATFLPGLEVVPMTQERRVERGFVALQGVAGTKEVPGGPYLLDRVEGQILSSRRYWQDSRSSRTSCSIAPISPASSPGPAAGHRTGSILIQYECREAMLFKGTSDAHVQRTSLVTFANNPNQNRLRCNVHSPKISIPLMLGPGIPSYQCSDSR